MTIRRVLGIGCVMLMTAALCRAEVKVGDTPKLKFESANDKGTVDMEKLRGKLVLIDFWATWCPDCTGQIEQVLKIHKEYTPRGLTMIGISLDKDKDKLLDYCKEKELTWPQYFDGKSRDNEIYLAWRSDERRGIPQSYLISPEGKVLWIGLDHKGVEEAIKDALEKYPPKKENK